MTIKITNDLTQMDYPRYDSYKDSGVDWLGEIPEGWRTEKGKWLFNKMDRPIREDDGIVTCFRDGEVTLRSNRRTDGFTNALKEHGYQGIRKGDLVIHQMDAFAGAIGVSDSEGKSTPVYSVCVPKEPDQISPYYYMYFMRSMALRGFILSLAKGIRERSTDFRYNDFSKLQLPLPPYNDQVKITEFIEHKTTQIDQAISLKQQQIAKLEEYKQIVIQNAVTKGLNSDALMKDSGVDWIGDIPEHWEVKNLKYIFDFIQTGTTPSTTNESSFNGDINWYNPRDLNSDLLKDAERKISSSALARKEVRLFNADSILVVGIGASSGKTAYMSVESTFNQQITGFHSKSYINKYFFYLIQSMSTLLLGLANYTTLPILNNSFFKSLPLLLPPISEQKEIVKFISSFNIKANEASKAHQNQIDRLKEYKTILINQAVTGKIKVS